MSKNTCFMDDCTKDARAQGMCTTHYQQQRRARLDPRPRLDPRQKFEQRFWSKVEKTETCWNWTGAKQKKAYGRFGYSDAGAGRTEYAHRISWEMANGPIPDGLVIDHKCHNPSCVNPDHLRACTQKENMEHRLGASINSATGLRGVYWSHATGKYRAVVKHFGVGKIIGEYDTAEEAGRVAAAKRNELFTHNDADRQVA